MYTIVGYDENDAGDSESINISGWTALLILAEAYGWEPEGTILHLWTHKDKGQVCCYGRPSEYNEKDGFWSEVEDWDGSYCSNDGQEMKKSDAANLASALEEAIKELPYTEDLFECKGGQLESEQREQLRKIMKSWSIPEHLELLIRMVSVLKRGRCAIY